METPLWSKYFLSSLDGYWNKFISMCLPWRSCWRAVKRGKVKSRMALKWCSAFQRKRMMPCTYLCWKVCKIRHTLTYFYYTLSWNPHRIKYGPILICCNRWLKCLWIIIISHYLCHLLFAMNNEELHLTLPHYLWCNFSCYNYQILWKFFFFLGG